MLRRIRKRLLGCNTLAYLIDATTSVRLMTIGRGMKVIGFIPNPISISSPCILKLLIDSWPNPISKSHPCFEKTHDLSSFSVSWLDRAKHVSLLYSEFRHDLISSFLVERSKQLEFHTQESWYERFKLFLSR